MHVRSLEWSDHFTLFSDQTSMRASFLGENEICMATLMQNILFIGGQARYGLAWLILHVQAERGRSVHLALNLIRRSLYKKAAAAQRFTS